MMRNVLASMYNNMSVYLIANPFEGVTPITPGTPIAIVAEFFGWLFGVLVWVAGAATIIALIMELVKHQNAKPQERPDVRKEMAWVVGLPAVILVVLYYANLYFDQLLALV